MNMRNLKLLIEYDGTKYSGWQVQNRPKARKTIQGEIEKALKKILHKKAKLIGAGRTDAGVHAKGYIANFKTINNIASVSLQKALNSLLPKDIVIHRVCEVPLRFHSRFDAKSKIYRYSVAKRSFPLAIGRDYIYYFPFKLDVDAMKRGAKYLIGRHDFSSFGSSSSDKKDPHCTIFKLDIKSTNQKIVFDVEADYFLYRMVRNIIGTLLEVGRGKITASGIKKILSSKDRCRAGPTVPAKGLSLIKVKY